ncbi:MAG: DUF885 family protein [Planctomycetota bacterium]
MQRSVLLLASLLVLAAIAASQGLRVVDPDAAGEVSAREAVEAFLADRALLGRRHLDALSPAGREARRERWRAALGGSEAVPFEALSATARIDRILLENRLRRELEELDREESREAEVADLVGAVAPIVALEEARRRFEFAPAKEIAATFAEVARALVESRRALDAGEFDRFDAVRARRAANGLRRVASYLRDFRRFRDGYDPEFGWWTKEPAGKLESELRGYFEAIESRLVAARSGGDATLVGEPIGVEALRSELAFEYIPYEPKRLIALAEREFAWCDAEMAKAAAELGFEDWREAQAHVKSLAVPPGKQPELIRDLANEAVAFLEARDLITIPPLAKEGWRMTMLSPAAQRVSPYFLGGEVIQVAYPTDAMSHEEKLMAMRSNNPHFSRATVQHELIPGHHLQGYMEERHRPYRRAFATPFWIEGWALYWEMRLWDLDFPRGPEDRIGMLFWRKHRCARIIFSLGFHSGTMTPRECVDFLVDRVGHERSAAEAEVRRSIGGDYSPLYQAAYMLGGLQIRALRRETVEERGANERRFHDEILRNNAMPIEFVRAQLAGTPLERGHRASWRFDGR